MSEAPTHPIDAFIATREELLRAAAEVPAAKRLQPFVGHWSLMDLLAHLTGWDRTNVEAIHDLREGKLPEFYACYDPGWASYNARLVEAYGTDDWDTLLASLAESQQEFVSLLGSLDPGDLTRSSIAWRGRPVTIAGILHAAIRDETEHLQQIRDFVSNQ